MTSALQPNGDLRLVIFDCDGVLIDSEASSCGIIAEAAREIGMPITNEDAVIRFSGKALTLIRIEIEKETGVSLPQNWCLSLRDRFVEAFRVSVKCVDGTKEMLDAVQKLELPVRVGSNSSMLEMDAKFEGSRLNEIFSADRIHSATDMNEPKPSPAVYLHAAEQEGVRPEQCVVLEDSDTGARAALDAGMACVLLRPEHEDAPAWPELIRIFHLSEFPKILENSLKKQKEFHYD